MGEPSRSVDLDPESIPVLEVVVTHEADAEQAELGGANRLYCCRVVDGDFRAPEPALLASVIRACDSPVVVPLRLSSSLAATGSDVTRLAGLAAEYLAIGAHQVSLGYLTRDLDLDLQAMAAIVNEVPGLSWRLDRSYDRVLDQRVALRQVAGSPGLAGIYTAGGATGVDAGLDDLVQAAHADDRAARLLTVCEARPEHVPWLVGAGITQVQVAAEVRATGSWTRAHVDAGRVRSWRLLLDEQAARS